MKMHSTHVVGVDPGLVHTGCVRLGFVPEQKELHVSHAAIPGNQVGAVVDWVLDDPTGHPYPSPKIFIEAYRPRSHFDSDARMVQLVADLKRELAANVLNNTGVLKVVKRPLMELLGVWSFSTVTHHQDLRSAARIALLGMLKTKTGNQLLTDMVLAHLRGEDWTVVQAS